MAGDATELQRLGAAVDAFGAAQLLSSRLTGQVRLVLDELVSNMLCHGGAQLAEIRMRRRADRVILAIEDDGVAFDPLGQAAPDLDLMLEDRPVGGLGIHLVRQLTDRQRYARCRGRNRLVLVKRLEPEGGP